MGSRLWPEHDRQCHNHSNRLWQPVELDGPVSAAGVDVAGVADEPEPALSAGQHCSRKEQHSPG